jgi:arylformamidase
MASPPAAPRVIDISVTLRARLATWPGEEFWRFDPVLRMDRGDPCNVSKIAMSVHMGTHVDAPWHFGKSERTVESIGMDRMILRARVVDLTGVERAIGRADLDGKLDDAPAALFKTRNSGKLERGLPFDKQFVHLDPSAADYLIERGVKTVGVDYLSVEGFFAEGAPVHHALLGAGVLIVEGLDLSNVAPGDYWLIVLPLKIEGADGAPARAVLVDGLPN